MPHDDLKRLRLYADRDQHGRIRTTYLVRQGDALSLAFADSDTDTLAVAVPAAPDQPPNRLRSESGLQTIGPLSYLALRVVFGRYGRPLDPSLDLAQHTVRDDLDDQPLPVIDTQGVEATLLRFRYKPFGWVYPADYLLWSPPGSEPLAAEAPLICSALSALARGAAAK